MIDMNIIPEDEFIKRCAPCRDNTISYETYFVNMRYYIAGEKFTSLLSTYNIGRSFLINAVNSDSWYSKVGINDKNSIIWHRYIYFLIAALLFNQCIDYFWQIIWAFLDSTRLTSVEIVKDHFRKCTKRLVVNKFDEIKKIDQIPKL